MKMKFTLKATREIVSVSRCMKLLNRCAQMEFSAPLKTAEHFTCTTLNGAVKLRLGAEGLAAEPAQTIPQFFKHYCQKYQDQPALCYQSVENAENAENNERSAWSCVKFAQYAENVEQAALLLLHIGLEPRTSIGILAHNCPEWFYINYGAIRAGGIVFGMYQTSSADAIEYMLQFADATICIVDDAVQMAKVRAVRKNLPNLQAVVQLNGPFDEFVERERGYYKWQNLFDSVYGEDLRMELRKRENSIYPNECAAIVFTSGTVGYPKAVMLSHDNIIFEVKSVNRMNPLSGVLSTVSYLPLSHIAGQMQDIYCATHAGGCVYIADRNALKGTLLKTLLKARPAALLSVPRILEKIKEQLLAREAQMGAVMRFLLSNSRHAVLQFYLNNGSRSIVSPLIEFVAFAFVRRVKKALGLDCCRFLCCGAAPLREDVRRFFLSLELPIYETYGLSEATGAVTFNNDLKKWKTSGQTMFGSEIKIVKTNESSREGEICQRGRNIFMGYLKNAAATAEVIDEDGWLHSGDLGYVDSDGFLTTTGRIKELVITDGGENIPPALIEEKIKQEMPFISNAMVVGDQRKFLIVLLTLKTEVDADTGQPLNELRAETVAWLQSLDLNYELLSDVLDTKTDEFPIQLHFKIKADIEARLAHVNAKALSRPQHVQKFALLPHDFSIPTGELGPTLKMRRNVIQQKYAKLIDALYN